MSINGKMANDLILKFLYRAHPDGTFETITLMAGVHDYFSTNKINVSYIHTVKNGLCYKLELENPFPFIQLMVNSNLEGMDRITKVNLMVAAKNTWQGIILNDWPYNQVPLKIGKDMVSRYANIYDVKLKEAKRKNLEGHNEFDDCMNNHDFEQGCISMFEPQTHHNENRYK